MSAFAGERRHATVVFSDLAGYTEMNESLDPEDVVETLAEIRDTARRIAEEHGGLLNQEVGDEVVMLFGMPAAHEDDPVRAVDAALALHAAVEELSGRLEARLGRRFVMHSGVQSGLVLFTQGDERSGLYKITGDAVNVGAHLRSSAAGGEILLGDAAHEVAAPFFETKVFGSLALKGRSTPVVAHQVVARRGRQSRFDVARERGLYPQVGREREIEALAETLAQAARGDFRSVAVVGDAGVGKSRLLHELRQQAVRGGFQLLGGRCESYGSPPPYHPFVDLLHSLFELQAGESGRRSAERVVAFVEGLGPELRERIPFYLALLSLEAPGHALPPGLVGGALQEQVLAALSALFSALSSRLPLAIVLEDWHWADPASDLAVQHLMEALDGPRAVVVVSYRPDPRPVWEPRASCVVDLAPLGADETAALAGSVLEVRSLGDSLSRFLFARTAGNPLFVEEYCRALRERGLVALEGGSARLSAAAAAEALPYSVEAVVRGRIDGLSPGDREVLSLASVVGTQFDAPLLALLAAEAGELPEALARLEAAHMIHPEGPSAYAFRHVVVKEVVYESLLRRRRRELHARVAEAIEGAEDERRVEHSEALARHFAAAEQMEKAALYAEMAGDKAARAHALEQAADQYRSAVGYLDALPESESQLHRRIRMSLKWGRASIWQPSPDHLDVLRVSEQAARRLGDAPAAMKALYWMGWQEYTLGNFPEAIERLQRCVEEAKSLSDARREGQAQANLAYCYAAARDYPRAREHFAAARALQARLSQPLWGDVYSAGYEGLIAGDSGDYEEAYTKLDAALAAAREQRELPLQASLLTQLGIVQSFQGDWQAALATSHEIGAISERVQGHYMLAMSETLQGYASFQLDRDPHAIATLEGAVESIEEQGARLSLSWNLACLAEALALAGESARAERACARALERVSLGDRLGEAMLHRALAIASVRRPEPDRNAAERHLARAGEVSSLPRETLLTRYWKASLLAELGADAQAPALAADVAAALERLQMPWYAERARSLASMHG